MSTLGTTSQTGTSASGGSTTEAAKGAASDVAGEARSAATDVKDAAKAEAGSVARDAKDRAGAVLRTSQDELRTQADSKARDLSSVLDQTARQLGSMADSAEDPSSTVAQLSKSAAEQLRRQSQRLEEGGFEGMIEDAKRLARNRPGVFMLGTVAAGFAVGRLAKHADLKQVADTAKQELTGGDDAGSPQASTGASVGQPASPRPLVASSPPAVGTVPADPSQGTTPGTGLGGRS